MNEWTAATEPPAPYRHVHARDEHERVFDAMVIQGGIWAHADARNFGVLANVSYWRPDPMWDFHAWLYDNHGVLVTIDADQQWICRNCSRRNAFANRIDHAETCLYRLAMERFL
jgi:hypothetical protein